MIRTIVADKTTAIFAAQAITAALFARERTGEGQHIRLAMLDTMIAYLWPEAMTQYTVVGREATTADSTARPDLYSRPRTATSLSGPSPIPSGRDFAPLRGERGSPRIRGSTRPAAGQSTPPSGFC
jgi:crotonobetainyl-CoA:carnitine CoA-transferase CaiB-like acyl-CoA transferase